MRDVLKKIGSAERHTFTGTFERFGMKRGYKGPVETILLLEIRDADGNEVTDHLWFNLTAGFAKLDLKQGDRVKFDGRVDLYQKGYRGYRHGACQNLSTDYKITYPSKVSKIN